MTTFFVLVTVRQYCNTGGMAASLARWLDHWACNEAKHQEDKPETKLSASIFSNLSWFANRISDEKKPIVLEAVRCAGILHPLIHQTQSPDLTQNIFSNISRLESGSYLPFPNWLLYLTFALNVGVLGGERCMFDGKFSDSVWLVCRLCCEIQHGGQQSRDGLAVT